ncbi:MAG: phosphoenolpyruvate synthase [Deltaproteobacteria bacterium]|nr:phosphoenolpyruvate synthase [Deltaproteobacteria bacterium]
MVDSSQKRDPRRYVRMLQEVDAGDVALVGGKNASLGDMIQGLSRSGIRVPEGVATTVEAYHAFLEENGMKDTIRSLMAQYREGALSLSEAGKAIRKRFVSGRFPKTVSEAIGEAYRTLCVERGVEALDVAVRSSATAEDLPEASFAGMLESYLNIRGEVALLDACRRCFSSLFTDRAIRYREEMGLGHLDVSLSVGILPMVRSDTGCAGVLFTIEKDTGFPDMVVITAAWGLGESVVQGAVIPDEYSVYKMFLDTPGANPILEKVIGTKQKKCVYMDGGGTQYIRTTEKERFSRVLDDADILTLGRWAVAIEAHYGRPMDIEWAKDGVSGMLYIVQARPVTVAYRRDAALSFCRLEGERSPMLTGISIGEGIATGKVCLLRSFQDIDQSVDASIIVSEDANTAWVSDLKERGIKAVVTDYGGRNSHAAIICKELGIPSVVGTRYATERLQPGQEITVHAIEGDHGYVYEGAASCVANQVHLGEIPHTRMKVMINVASAAAAYQWWRLPCAGIGLVRMDYILQHVIKIHPMALVRYDTLTERSIKYQIEAATEAYADKKEYFVARLSACLAKIAASRLPDPVMVRLSNLEPSEYGVLTGGRHFEETAMRSEPDLRGVRRYLSPQYREAFELECEAFRRARAETGLTNLHLMIPHCETPADADTILDVLEDLGLKKGKNGLSTYLCCDFPTNLAHASDFASRFDGISLDMGKLSRWIRSNESILQDVVADATNEAFSMENALRFMRDAYWDQGRSVMVRDRMFINDYAPISLLVDVKIDAISVDPESIPTITEWIARAEREKEGRSNPASDAAHPM